MTNVRANSDPRLKVGLRFFPHQGRDLWPLWRGPLALLEEDRPSVALEQQPAPNRASGDQPVVASCYVPNAEGGDSVTAPPPGSGPGYYARPPPYQRPPRPATPQGRPIRWLGSRRTMLATRTPYS